MTTPLWGQFSGPPNNAEEYREQYEWRIKQERLFGVYVPRGLDEAIARLDELTDEDSRQKFAALPEERAYRRLYHSLRLWIIENWGFNGGSRLSHVFSPFQIAHPDDLAELIIVSWHRHLNGKDRNLKELVEGIRERRKAIWSARQSKQ